MGKTSIPDLTGQSLYIRSHQAELPYWRQLGLIRQSLHTNANQAFLGIISILMSTRPHQAEPLYQCKLGLIRQVLIKQDLHTGSQWASSSYQYQPGFTGQSLYIRPQQMEPLYQVSLGKVFTPTSTRLYQAELLHQRQLGFIGQSLYINTI